MLSIKFKFLSLAIILTNVFFLRAMEPKALALSKEQASKVLLEACLTGILENAKRALDSGADINAVDIDRGTLMTPLHYAALYSHGKLVRELIARGASVNVRAFDGPSTPLHYARMNCNPGMVRELLIYGARPTFDPFTRQDIIGDIGGDLSYIEWATVWFFKALSYIECATVLCSSDMLVKIIEQRAPLSPEELQNAFALAVGQGRADTVAFLVSNYNLPQTVLFNALRIIRVIFTRFELLQHAAQDDKARARLAQELQPYQAIYALLVEQLYRVNSPPVAFLDRLPSEIFKLLLWFVINTRPQK
jgi:hypothetical protein